MPEYHPVTDAEWRWLQRRFAALERLPGMRELFNNSLNGSPYTTAERRHFRRQIYVAVRGMMAPTEAYPNPWFELTWFRAVEDNPSLLDDIARNRALLWEAYFMPAEPPGLRERRVVRWQNVAGEDVELVITTDEELEAEQEDTE
jgi:hypothetical protein